MWVNVVRVTRVLLLMMALNISLWKVVPERPWTIRFFFMIKQQSNFFRNNTDLCLLYANASRTFVRARAFVSFGIGEGALSEGKINTRVHVSATDRFSPLHEGTELCTRIVCEPGLKHTVVANSSLLYCRPFPILIVNSRTCHKVNFSRMCGTTEWSPLSIVLFIKY